MKTPAQWVFLSTVIATLTASTVEAQTQRAIERRIDRNARQMQRQANRVDYYTPQVWQQLDPWVQRYGVVPLAATVGNVVSRAVDAADGRVDGRFGFRNNTPQNAWFYDYYSYTPTYYYSQPNNERYVNAIRYFDADNDGIYESYSSFRDSDNDGIYDEYDRFDFQPQAPARSKETTESTASASSSYVGPEDARRHKVEGEIGLTKTAQVNGQEHLLVGLKQERDTLAIDLGPANAMQGKQIEVGKSIVAFGAMERIGEKQLLVANSIQIGNGQTMQIDRASGLKIAGSIVDVMNTKIGSQEHYMAVVEAKGERQLVDLGPVSTYKVKLQPATQIVVYGVPVRSQKHRIIMADRVQLGKEFITINRSQSYHF